MGLRDSSPGGLDSGNEGGGFRTRGEGPWTPNGLGKMVEIVDMG